MDTARYTLNIQRGATYSTRLDIQDGSSGSPFDFTGYAVDGQIRSSYESSVITAAFTCSIDTPPTSGTLYLILHPSSSANLTGSCYFYDVRLTSGSYVTYLLEGKATVSPRVTR